MHLSTTMEALQSIGLAKPVGEPATENIKREVGQSWLDLACWS